MARGATATGRLALRGGASAPLASSAARGGQARGKNLAASGENLVARGEPVLAPLRELDAALVPVVHVLEALLERELIAPILQAAQYSVRTGAWLERKAPAKDDLATQ